jgi:hypothetical protein
MFPLTRRPRSTAMFVEKYKKYSSYGTVVWIDSRSKWYGTVPLVVRAGSMHPTLATRYAVSVSAHTY